MSRLARRYDVVIYAPMLAPLLAANDVGSAGGAETQLVLVARMLAEQGLRVCLATYNLPGASIPNSIHGIDIALRPIYERRGTLKRMRELVGLVRDLMALDASVYLTRIASYHVGAVAIAARLRRRRFVYSSAHVTDFVDHRSISPTRRDHLLYSFGLSLAHEIVVQTEEQVVLCRDHLGREPILVPNVVESATPRTEPGDAFLWLGRAVWYKGPLAYVELARALPEAKFLAVVIPVPDESEIFEQMREAAAGLPNLVLLEARSRRELGPIYRRAVAIVNTSRFEGMPNTTLEGWAHGVPALTLEHDPDGLIAANGLGIFAGGSWEQLVAGACELWDSRARATELSDRCNSFVRERYGASGLVGRWLAALRLEPGRAAPAAIAEVA
jgi:glycosyltransferase involved in cell wall biosynthesis